MAPSSPHSTADPVLPPSHASRPPIPPPVLVPQPFTTFPHPHRTTNASAEGLEDADEGDDSDGISEASSVTAGRASMELLRYKEALGSSFDSNEAQDDDGEDSGKDEERARLVEETDMLDPEGGEMYGTGSKKVKQQRRRRFLCFLLCAFALLVLLVSLVTYLFADPTASSTALHRHRFEGKGLKKMTLDELKNGTFWTERAQLNWLAEAGDGVFSQRGEDGSIYLTDLNKNLSRVLVAGDDVKDPRTGEQLAWEGFKVSPDMQFILFSTDSRQQWRHSTLSNFYLHRISPVSTLPLTPTSASSSSRGSGRTSLAVFAPTGHTLAYVETNDLFVVPESDIDAAFEEGAGLHRRGSRVTDDGGMDKFNGVNDWVYEEEVFSSSSALWWSPTSSHLAFLSFDESAVPSYDFPIYNSESEQYSDEGAADAYPEVYRMRYPKAGYPNPLVRVRVFDLSSYLSSPSSRPTLSSTFSSSSTVDPAVRTSLSRLELSNAFLAEETLVTELAWVGETDLLVKFTQRDAAVERIGYFQLGAAGSGGEDTSGDKVVKGKTVRETDWVKRDGGWAEPTQNIVPLLASKSPSSSAAPIPSYPPGCLDVLPSPSGFMHLAYFSPPDAREPVWLTSGQWEIDGGVLQVDLARGFVYVLASRPSIERHLLRVTLPKSTAELALLRSAASKGVEVKQLTSEKERGYHSVNFSPGGGVYVLDYLGPGIPTQKILKVDDPDYSYTLTDNSALREVDTAYAHAELDYSTVSLPVTVSADGTGASKERVDVNVLEMRPPLMDVSGRTKYPVLFQVYGGPSSQMVNTRWQRDWQHYLCTSNEYLIVRLDGRGTGFKGRKFRTGVRGNLGALEAQDVIEAARVWAKKAYVDEKRIGIWGWSYGGFLTTKVIEANSSVFSLGMAVAPVSDWRYYDSVYTERYMGKPDDNPAGYRNSSVHEMDGFNHATYVLAHGTGDDNVHWSNTANLLDRFTVAGVRDFHLRVFVDSDHSILTRNAYWELMHWLESNLLEHFGVGGRTKHRWKMTAGEQVAE
ncbi:hypothetical protein JCM8547_003828 [Rhodosporidiobolus lusitaniae]